MPMPSSGQENQMHERVIGRKRQWEIMQYSDQRNGCVSGPSWL